MGDTEPETARSHPTSNTELFKLVSIRNSSAGLTSHPKIIFRENGPNDTLVSVGRRKIKTKQETFWKQQEIVFV